MYTVKGLQQASMQSMPNNTRVKAGNTQYAIRLQMILIITNCSMNNVKTYSTSIWFFQGNVPTPIRQSACWELLSHPYEESGVGGRGLAH